ncbi:MAG TPA: peptidoglycan-binding protein [Acidimicrobiia bacterium]|nr:peptidoglycan-binding protein [Acidimicrobiia bacterium]
MPAASRMKPRRVSGCPSTSAPLQADLSAAGYYTGTIDGLYGPDTIAAVVQLQQDAGLPETGLLDPATQTALAAILARGTSAQVGALQGILISTGYYDGAVDGVWSPAVEQALKDLQGDLGVPATGVVDAATLRAFERALEEAGQAPVTTTVPPPGPTTTQAAEPTTTQASPTTAPPTSDGILQVLAGNGQFGQFLAAVEAAGLTDMLSGPGPFTVFAPTDEAFAAAGDLPTDPEALSALVLHHVVEGAVSGFDLQGLSSVTTAQGSDLAVSVDQGQIVLDGISTITVSNVVGSNGLAHVVNAVLVLPG